MSLFSLGDIMVLGRVSANLRSEPKEERRLRDVLYSVPVHQSRKSESDEHALICMQPYPHATRCKPVDRPIRPHGSFSDPFGGWTTQ